MLYRNYNTTIKHMQDEMTFYYNHLIYRHLIYYRYCSLKIIYFPTPDSPFHIDDLDFLCAQLYSINKLIINYLMIKRR